MKMFIFFLVIIITSFALPQQLPQIFWVADDGFSCRIQTAFSDGTGMHDIITDLKYARSLVLDTTVHPHEIYFADGSALSRIRIDGTGLWELMDSVAGVSDIELDVFNHKVYWSVSTFSYDLIIRADMHIHESGVDTLYHSTTGGIDIGGIALDHDMGQVYWTELNNGGQDRIMRMSKSGENKELVINNLDVLLSAPRDIDYAKDSIYWTDSGVGAHWIMRSTRSGLQIDTVLKDVSSFSIAINHYGETIYYTSGLGIYYTFVDSANKILLFNSNFGGGYAIAYSYDTTLITSATEIESNLSFQLAQNYPNPFNPETSIRYSIPVAANVIIKIFDVLGEEITDLVDEKKSAGSYEFKWNATGQPSGVYFYQLRAGDFIQMKKMILMK